MKEEESIFSELKLSELKQQNFRETLNQLHDQASAVLFLTVQWKEIEEHFDSARSLIGEKAKELHSIQERVRERVKEVERQEREFELREKELEGIQELVEKGLRGMEEKEMELKGVGELVDERCREIEVREGGIELKKRELEGIQEFVNQKFREIERREKELEGIQELVNEKFGEIREREKGTEWKEKELGGIQELVKKRFWEIEVRELEIDLKEKGLMGIQELVNVGSREIEVKEKELEGIQEFVNQKFREIEVREKETESKEKGIELKEKEIEGDQELVRKGFAEIEVREKGVELKRKELEGIEESVKERFREIEVKERGIQLKENELKGIREIMTDGLKEAERKERELEGIKASVKARIGGIEVKEKECEKLLSELKVKELQVEEKSRELKFKEQRVGKRFRDFLVKEKKFEEECNAFNSNDEKVVERFKAFELKEKEIQERCKGLELNENKFEQRCKEFKLKEMKVEGQCEVLKLKENQLEERIKEAELERKNIMEQYKELESKKEFEEHYGEIGLKERKFADTLVKIEPTDTHMIQNAMDPRDANLCSSVTMNGISLQMFLNEHCKDHDCRRGEVEIALRVSSDPAMLVLNAIEGFYPPHLKKGDLEFEAGVVRRNCILLLEQLMKISPEIRPHVKKQAKEIASDWSKKMRVNTSYSLEVLGFLQLLASYGLASDFNSDKLLKYLEIVSQHREAPELFRSLGFSDKISGFIQNLIGKKQQVEAVKFIYAFDLVNKFPPGLLLKGYLNDSKLAAKRMSKRNKSREGQIETTNKRIADLMIVLRCIEDHKIESELLPKDLKRQIELWEKENLKRKEMLPELSRKSQPPNLNEKKCLTPKIEAAAVARVIEPKSPSAINTNSPRHSSTAVSTATPSQSIAVTAPSKTAAPFTAAAPTTAAATTLSTVVNSPSPTATPITTTSPTTTAPPTKITSPSPAPTSITPKIEPKDHGVNKQPRPQNQGGKKRPRVSATSEVPRKASFRDTNHVHSAHHPRQQPTGLIMDPGVPYLNGSGRHYSLDGYPCANLQFSPYYAMPYYQMPMSSWKY